ncbi:MAG: tRNA 5-hydroxyuridine modification protein YegQ [Spirochaetia bacterium]|nr:tRNA 5-hydroxyuridine modification protein YegQ [Spirochaetia bacterium]
MKRPELLLPAGNLEKMRSAFAFGADAVYAGSPRYSLRMRNNEFQHEELAQGIEEAHVLGKQFYVTANILPHNDKVKTFIRDMAPLIAMKPDALIMADPGLISLVREEWPEVPVHLSVQANTMNFASVKFWHKLGIPRIILSRELRIDELEEIKQLVPEMEIEVFVHGSLCIAYSGRCLLSGYFNHRDSNQGNCSNACRWNYKVEGASESDAVAGSAGGCGCSSGSGDSSGSSCSTSSRATGTIDSETLMGGSAGFGNAHVPRHPLADEPWFIEEKSRPGQKMPVFEDEHGTYIMNSKDLRAIEHVQQLMEIGIDSFKIEGRTKSRFYVARTAQAYRRAIDDAMAGKTFDQSLLGDLDRVASRGYTDGFFSRKGADETQNYDTDRALADTKYSGDVISYDSARGTAVVQVKNLIRVGDVIEIVHPTGNFLTRVPSIHTLDGKSLSQAPGDGWTVMIPCEKDLTGGMVAVTQEALTK